VEFDDEGDLGFRAAKKVGRIAFFLLN